MRQATRLNTPSTSDTTHPSSSQAKPRWQRTLIVLLGGLALVLSIPQSKAISSASAAPAGLHRRDWAAIQALVPHALSQQAYIKASNMEAEDSFGYGMAISGDTLVIGAPGEDSAATEINGDQDNNSAQGAGAVYVLVRSGATWSQQAYLKASNSEAGDGFGISVGISGDMLVVGATGEDSAATGVNGDQTNNAVAQSGAAYVFVRSGATWTQQAYLKPSNPKPDNAFGLDVGISGETVVVGTSQEDSAATGINGDQNDTSAPLAGAAYVFARTDGVWSQQAYLKASNAEAYDVFGRRVAISGDTVVVGAMSESSAATGVNGDQTNNLSDMSGAAYVFVRNGTTWTQQAYLKASNNEPQDTFGSSVAISGGTIIVGAIREDSGAAGINSNQNDNSAPNAGAAYVFVRNGTTWTQQAYLKASNTESNDYFGLEVAIADDRIVVGARGEDSATVGVNGLQSNNTAVNSGAAYLLGRNSEIWSQQAYLKASNTETEDEFASHVAVSGDTVVVVAHMEQSAATGVNGDQSDNSAIRAGAVYVFAEAELQPPTPTSTATSQPTVITTPTFIPTVQATATPHLEIQQVFLPMVMIDHTLE